MKTYKAPDNSLHVIDPEFAYLLPAGCVEITDEEAATIRAASVPHQDPKANIQANIDQIERETLMNRAIREFVIALADQQGAAAGLTPDQLYQANAGYHKVKDVDNQIVALRTQLDALP